MRTGRAWVLAMAGGLAMVAAANAGEVSITASEGWVIFDPTKDGQAYRYGPSIIVNDDGSIDAWFASPGGPGADGIHQWDWIRHKRSADGGRTWGPETVVLRPTEGSHDRMSVCDPGVVRFGGWYYLGVTAVEDPEGNCNEVFVARARTPEGPYEKWDGRGWGGSPEPIVAFTTPANAWGAGEPSFVLKDGTLYLYYTWWITVPGEPHLNQTRVATAPADDPNWPAELTYRGVAFDREEGEDSADVKYVDALGRFVQVASAKRMSAEAYLLYRESEDGIHWGPPSRVTGPIEAWCHNAGISGTAEGHLRVEDANFVAYAYSRETKVNWAFWYTQLNPVEVLARGAGSGSGPGR